MKMQIKEFAIATGVSIRTIHYYDEIGLLTPAYVDKITGYRYYDENSILRMQEILFYRELDFPLKSIKEILTSPDYDKDKVLNEQKELLILKKERLEKIIFAIDAAKEGENVMRVFDNSKFEKYKNEVKEKWGQTEAYKEYSEKTKTYSKEKWNNLASGMDQIMAMFSVCMKNGDEANSIEAQELVRKLQNHISENYYHCTNEILASLGWMYVADERFKNNIDKHAIGTAEYISKAINFYCKK